MSLGFLLICGGSIYLLLHLFRGREALKKEAEMAALPAPVSDYSIAEEHAVTTGGETTLLIIDDNDELRLLIVEFFRHNYRLLEAANGREGLAIAQRHMPDIIVCDVAVPEMNGFEVCRKLRSDFNSRHIPVILIATGAATGQILEGFESGADDYLLKPFDFKILEAKIRTQFRIREAARLQYTWGASTESGLPTLKGLDEEFAQKLRGVILENLSDGDFGVDGISKNSFFSATYFS